MNLIELKTAAVVVFGWSVMFIGGYFAGRYDVIKEIESNGWIIEWLTPFQMRLTKRTKNRRAE